MKKTQRVIYNQQKMLMQTTVKQGELKELKELPPKIKVEQAIVEVPTVPISVSAFDYDSLGLRFYSLVINIDIVLY
jgi:hypothetical protein